MIWLMNHFRKNKNIPLPLGDVRGKNGAEMFVQLLFLYFCLNFIFDDNLADTCKIILWLHYQYSSCNG